MKKTLIIVLVVLAILVVGLVGSYNGLVVKSEKVDSQWSQVENQLKRRADLIPNLVETIKGYTSHEEDIILLITEARAELNNAKGPEDFARADENLNKAIDNLNIIVENYPDLKASDNFKDLQAELAGTENRISVARMDYNNSVEEFNRDIIRFPKNIFANLLGFEKKEYFKIGEEDKEVPKVDFKG